MPRRLTVRFLIALGLLALVILGGLEWAARGWKQPGPSKSAAVILIAPRTPSLSIARMLEKRGLVSNALLFEFDLGVRGLTGRIKAGEYAVPPGAGMADLAAILISGKSIQHKLTAAEGLTSRMIWRLVVADPVLAGNAGPVPQEGALLPETYLFTRGMTRAALLERMRRAQETFLAAHWPGRAADLPFDTRDQAVILASIVEKESALPQERRHIAAVFINRLKAGMKLQSDPTIIYGITQGYPLGRGIRQSEIESATPYNTYVITGLPPTPICNPGKDSLAAVLDPEDSKDLYFVASGSGGHVFAATIAEHARNVLAYRAAERLKAKSEHPEMTPEPRPMPKAKPKPRRRRHG